MSHMTRFNCDLLSFLYRVESCLIIELADEWRSHEGLILGMVLTKHC